MQNFHFAGESQQVESFSCHGSALFNGGLNSSDSGVFALLLNRQHAAAKNASQGLSGRNECGNDCGNTS